MNFVFMIIDRNELYVLFFLQFTTKLFNKASQSRMSQLKTADVLNIVFTAGSLSLRQIDAIIFNANHFSRHETLFLH